MPANGYLPASALSTVQTGITLSTPTANAYRALVAAAKRDGRTISIAPPAGGYRSYAVQADMHHRPWLYGMNPASGATLAAPGTSNHGLGICVDLVGTDLAYIIRLAAKYGFTRPLRNDPNHFIHDGRTAIGAPAVKRAAAELASKKVLVTVTADDTLGAIAVRHHVTIAHLLHLNPTIGNPNRITLGQRIRVA